MSLLPRQPSTLRRFIALVSATCFCFAQFSLPSFAAADAQRKISFYHPDHLGSTNLITNEAGQIVERITYKPYGAIHTHEIRDPNTGQLIPFNMAPSVTPTPYTPYHFTGQRRDTSTGLYFYHARYYDPHLGRFTQADTIVPQHGDPQALNRYSYVRNNPLKYTDPSGHGWWSKFWNWFKGGWWDQQKAQWTNPWWWLQKGQWTPIAPGTTQQFNKTISATATFLVNQWGFSPAAANATIGAVLAIPSGGSSLIAAGLAYGTTELLGTGEARQLIGNLAGFFEQFGVSPEAAATLATQVVSAGVTVAVSVASSAARELYVKVVRYQPTWAKGGAAVSKWPLDPPREGANNVFNATQSPNEGFCCGEGSLMSRVANLGPGINATSGMHDMFQIGLRQWGGNAVAWALNVPGMPLAAGITYFALLTPGSNTPLIYSAGPHTPQGN